MLRKECDTKRELKKWLKSAERIVIAGIGNTMRMDDFVGVKIVQDLKDNVSDSVMLIECETVPESYMQQIVEFKPTHILLIDAAILGLNPGESRLKYPEHVADLPALSTHMLPLRIFCEYLTRTTKTKIALMLIEPQTTDFGEGLTPEIEAAAQFIVSILVEALPQKLT